MFWITVVLLLFILILCGFTKDSLHYLWTFINFMQLLVHLPLLQVPVPASALYLLRTLFPWFSFTSIFYDYKLSLFAFSGTPPFALSFDRLGYHARHTTVNLGTLNWVIVFAMVLFFITVVTYVLARLIKSCSKCRESLTKS